MLKQSRSIVIAEFEFQTDPVDDQVEVHHDTRHLQQILNNKHFTQRFVD